MTPKQTLKVDLKDIPHIEMSCTKCSGAIVIPIPSKVEVFKGVTCPACNEALFVETSKAATAVTGLIQYLSEWKNLNQSKCQLFFSLTE